jgi:type I restriction enzyme S subunit
MSKQTKDKIIPKLRFPEFKYAGDWEVKELSELGDLINGLTYSPDDIRDKGLLVLRSSNIQGGFIDLNDCVYVRTDIKGANLSVPNDILVCVRNGSKDLIGKNAIIPQGITLATHGAFMTVFRAKNPEFAFQLFQTNFYETQVKADLGATINSINGKNFLKYEFPVPSIPKEQQKIASCLSSLDELIAAENQKLEALKTHKKGLMQQLFPAEGETVPKLRFVEFLDSGEWEEKPLGDMTEKVGSGVTPLGGDINYKSNGRPFVRSQNVGWGIFILEDIVFIEEQTHQNSISTEIKIEDVLLNITGASIGRCVVADSRVSGGNVNQHVCIIRTIKKLLSPAFLNQFIISSGGQKQIDSFQAGGNRQGLNFVQIRSFSIPVPPDKTEQQKIASCLSSLDELIAAQSQKIEALKVHKKGLMQGMFPEMSELPTCRDKL